MFASYPGAAYRWFVAVVPNSVRRSVDQKIDKLPGDTVKPVEMPAELKAKLAHQN